MARWGLVWGQSGVVCLARVGVLSVVLLAALLVVTSAAVHVVVAAVVVVVVAAVLLVCAVWQQRCVACLIGGWWARRLRGCTAAALHGLSRDSADIPDVYTGLLCSGFLTGWVSCWDELVWITSTMV